MNFLNKLKQILRVKDVAEFSELCGKNASKSKMRGYLDGSRKPDAGILEDCLLNATVSRVFHNPSRNKRIGRKAERLRDTAFEQAIRLSEWEIRSLPDSLSSLPKSAGVYILYDSAPNVIYVGQAMNFAAEVRQTLKRKISTNGFGPDFGMIAKYISLYEIENKTLRHNIEVLLIRALINQTYNKNIGHFK